MELGLTDDEFYFMPFCEYSAFFETWLKKNKRESYRTAELCATIMNQNPYRKKAVSARELMGDSDDQKPVNGEHPGVAQIRLMLNSIRAQKNAKK